VEPPVPGAGIVDGPTQPPGPDHATMPAAIDERSPAAGEQAGALSDLADRYGPLVLGAGGGLLAAGALRALRRRRRYRLAHRSPGALPASPGRDLEPIERAIHGEADDETGRWLHTAFLSLAGRPIWEGEAAAQPVLGRLAADHLEIELSAPDPMGAPVPWSSTDDGLHWRLGRRDEIAPLPPGTSTPVPAMATIGAGTYLNLEAVGVLAVGGTGDGPLALVRSIVHELATSPSAGTIDVRSTLRIAGVEAYGLVQLQAPQLLVAELVPWLDDTGRQMRRARSTSAYAHRLDNGDEPLGPVIVVTDAAGLARMAPIERYAAERTWPLAMVVVGGSARTGVSIEIGPDRAVLAPWDLEIEVQGLAGDLARQLGALLAQAATTSEVPLTAGSRPPAEVTGAGDGGDPGGEAAITVRVLGDVDAQGTPGELTSQQLSLVCFLACNGPSSRATIIEALWDGQMISRSRFPNLLAETRARIGRHHFPEVRDGRYELAGVATDLARFERYLALAAHANDGAAASNLCSALELVRGVPFTPPGSRYWSWVGDATHHAARLEATVADAAARLAHLQLEAGELEGARWACEQGLCGSPTDEALVTLLTEIYVRMGKPGLARRLVDGWEEKISRMECGEPSDEPRKRLAG
jgi:DNA-binding SARP family transcriptional activator